MVKQKEHSMKNFILITALIAIAVVWGNPPASAGDKEEANPIDAAFVAGKCTVCHKIDKICSKVGKQSEATWTKIISKMVARGAKLDESEQKQTTAFISALPEGKNSLCP
jgi:hypothetical protein